MKVNNRKSHKERLIDLKRLWYWVGGWDSNGRESLNDLRKFIGNMNFYFYFLTNFVIFNQLKFSLLVRFILKIDRVLTRTLILTILYFN